MLSAQVEALGPGIEACHLGIAKDDPADLREKLAEGFRSDVLILSGGVSMGDFDYVHTELKARGLEVALEKVAIKPGKPLVFGRVEIDGHTRHVFGLPGNPVSSFVTFELFVKPFLRASCGLEAKPPEPVFARVGADIGGKAIPRTQHLPARVHATESGVLAVETITWNGSGDLRGLVDANSLVVVPRGEAPPREGDMAEVFLLEPAALPRPGAATRA